MKRRKRKIQEKETSLSTSRLLWNFQTFIFLSYLSKNTTIIIIAKLQLEAIEKVKTKETGREGERKHRCLSQDSYFEISKFPYSFPIWVKILWLLRRIIRENTKTKETGRERERGIIFVCLKNNKLYNVWSILALKFLRIKILELLLRRIITILRTQKWKRQEAKERRNILMCLSLPQN